MLTQSRWIELYSHPRPSNDRNLHMSKLVELGRLLLAEAWYQALRWAPVGVGSLGMGACVLWNSTAIQKTSVATVLEMGTLLWQRVWKDTTCLSLTPSVRSACKSYCAWCLKDAEDVKVHDGFTQCVTRFLFEPRDDFWIQREKLEVQTLLQDGSIETRSWLRKGKGIFAFPCPADLDDNVTAQSPYSFCREDGSTASVRMWTKTVDEGLKSAFNLQTINQTSDLNDFQERIAYTDFTLALVNLLGPEALQQGIIWKCIEKKQTVRKHLAIEGKLTSVIKVLKEHPWTSRHYFRCFASDEGAPALHANLGFGQAHLDFFPGKGDENIVLYIREGTKEHACPQSSKVFALDNRFPLQ